MISLRDGAAIWWVAVALVLDQITKAIVVNTMTLHSPVSLIGDVVRLTYIHNAGAAFGLKLGSPLLHTVVAKDYAAIKEGARVQAGWKEERTGHIRDLDYLALLEEA